MTDREIKIHSLAMEYLRQKQPKDINNNVTPSLIADEYIRAVNAIKAKIKD